MQISKATAEKIALKLTEKKSELVAKLKLEYRQYITDCYNKQIPAEIKEAFEKYPQYFRINSSITFSGHGFQWESVTPTERTVSNESYNAVLNIEKYADKAKKLQNKFLDASKELDELKHEIQTALYGLKTFAQIEKNLPEAIPYLPKSTSLSLMVDLNSLRSKINKKGL
jgi:hypothetical protein